MIERLARMSVREQALTFGFMLLVCGFIVYAALVEPHLVLLHSSSAKIWSQEHLLMVRRQHISEQTMKDRERGRLLEQIESLSARYLTNTEATEFLAELSAMAEAAETRLVKVDFLQERELRGMPDICVHRLPAEAECADSEGMPADAFGGARLPVRKRVRLTLRGTSAEVMRLLEEIEARTTKVHVGELTMEIVSADSAELNASFVLTLFTLGPPDEEES